MKIVALCLAAALAAPTAAPGFTIERIASVQGARELALTPAGDLFAGTSGGAVYVVAHAEDVAGSARVFASPGDDPAAGVAFAGGSLYVGTQHAIWRIPYRPGQPAGAPVRLVDVRTGEAPAGSDGDVHTTTSVAAAGSRVFASVGSSCNACVETDSTRATAGEVRGGRYVVLARRIRNAIGLAVDERGNLWATDAGQDELPPPHPYEFLDNVSAHNARADYGWPFCYENGKRKPRTSENCGRVAVPAIIFPAYETPIGAAFYPTQPHGRYAFPAQYRGGVFVTLHGSWHGPAQGLAGYVPPRVVFVAMRGDRAAKGPDWNDPSRQWTPFVTGYQRGGSHERSGRPTGVAVGPQGSLFVADDQEGAIYRIRPR
ncbi:MAG: sorbosone dehydrogenase family protein [Candidatus Baltobacteraceae bacterium]